MDLASLDPDELLRRVSAAGLRGRGGGWYPAARKWQAVRVEGGDPIVVANGAEGEPGAIKDRWLMLTRPDDVVAGLLLAARAVRAREAVVYLKGSFEAQQKALEGALARATAYLDVRVVRGDDTYVAGEETAILEVLEGRRAWPREKPPYPAGVGLYGRPTLVQNVETLARVPAAVADPDRFRADETTLVSLWGDVRRPGVYDVPLGTRLGEILDEHGQGTTEEPGWLFPAGPSAPPLKADATHLDLPLDPEALKAAGTALGSAALLVIGASANPLTLARSLAAFFERESCGQCPPCVVGSRSLLKVALALEEGEARAADLRHLQEAAGFMRPHGYCAHSRTAANAVTGMLDRAKDAVAARLGGNEPAGRQATPFEPDSRERAAIEQVLATTWRKRAG
jgi:NADH-quinone oxidoreductase subunit F